MTVEFYSDKHGNECVTIKDEKKYMDTRIAIKSKNGRFSAVADLWYEDIPYVDEDGKTDVSIEEIEDSDTLVVLDGNTVAYSIKGIDDIDEDCTVLCDDGTIALFENDENLVVYTPTGRKISRKPPFDVIGSNLDEDIAWFWGDDDNGNSKFNVFQLATLTSWTRRLPPNASSIQAIYLHEDDSIWVQYETYDNEFGIAAYTLDGKKIVNKKRPMPKRQETAEPEADECDEEHDPVPSGSAALKKRQPKSNRWIMWWIAILVVGTIVRCSQ